MTQGRMKNGRYQQGIGTPDTLGVQPTTWEEPKAPELKRMSWDAPNAGVSRNYGSTPDYVDTWKSRWEVPEPGKFFDTLNKVGQTAGNLKQSRINNSSASSTTPTP